MSERPLDIHYRIIIILTLHSPHFLAWFIIIRSQWIDEFRIGKRQSTTKIPISWNQISQRISSIVSRQQDMHYRLCQRLYLTNNTRTSLIQYQDYRLSGSGKRLYQLYLVRRKMQIVQISRSLTISIFSDTSDNNIRLMSGSNRFPYFRFIFFPPIIMMGRSIGHSGFINDIICPKSVTQRLINRMICLSKFIRALTLPTIRPTTVKTTHSIRIRSCQQNLHSFA